MVFVAGIGLIELSNQLLKFVFGYDIIHTFSFNNLSTHAFSIGSILLISVIYSTILYWKRIQNRETELINEKNLAELQNLKAQVNPHFLFNTLNNLYYLCLKKDNVAPDLLLKLSDLMRYIVTVEKQDWVNISDELKQITNYIELEKMRLTNPEVIRLNINIKDQERLIAPLILLPFIENAFKHSKSRIEEGINISLEDSGDIVLFKIENLFDEKETRLTTKTGLQNIKRRLDLIYPNKHQLQISQQKNKFKVDLKIQ